MSLINKMLIELEERRPEGEAFSALQGQLRAAPDVSRQRLPRWIAWACAVPLCGTAIWIAYEHHASSAIAHVREQAPSFHLRLSTGLDQLPAVTQDMAASVAPTQATEPAAASLSNDASQGTPGTESSPTTTSAKSDEIGKLVSATNKSNFQGSATESSTQRSASFATLAADSVQKNVAGKNSPGAARKEEINTGRSGHALLPAEPAAHSAPKADAGPVVALTKQFKELTVQQRAENEYRRASNFIQQGKLGEAISMLEQALNLDPQHMPAFQALVEILIDAKRHEEAVRRLQEKSHHERSHAQLAMTLARLQVDRGETKGAIDTLQKSLPHASNRADYQAFLAALYQREGRNKDAAELYMLALSKSPQNGIWWMGLGISLQALNRLPEARDAFHQARENNLPSADLRAFVEQKLTQLQ